MWAVYVLGRFDLYSLASPYLPSVVFPPAASADKDTELKQNKNTIIYFIVSVFMQQFN